MAEQREKLKQDRKPISRKIEDYTEDTTHALCRAVGRPLVEGIRLTRGLKWMATKGLGAVGLTREIAWSTAIRVESSIARFSTSGLPEDHVVDGESLYMQGTRQKPLLYLAEEPPIHVGD